MALMFGYEQVKSCDEACLAFDALILRTPAANLCRTAARGRHPKPFTMRRFAHVASVAAFAPTTGPTPEETVPGHDGNEVVQ
jgi:hypothetical protein